MNPLRRLRKQKRLSQIEVARGTGLDQGTLSRIERSRRSRESPGESGATPEQAARLARFFGHAVTETQILYPLDYSQEPDFCGETAAIRAGYALGATE